MLYTIGVAAAVYVVFAVNVKVVQAAILVFHFASLYHANISIVGAVNVQSLSIAAPLYTTSVVHEADSEPIDLIHAHFL